MVEEVETSTVDETLIDELLVEVAERGRGRITESGEAALDSPANAGTVTIDGSIIVLDAELVAEVADKGRGRITEPDELDSPADAGTVTIDGSMIVLDAGFVAEIGTVVVAVAYGIVKTPSPERSVDVDELVG